MINETLTTSNPTSASTTLTKGNAQMAIQGVNNPKGYIKLNMTVGGAKVPIFEGKLPRNAAKVVVISDETATFQFDWEPEDSPDNAEVIVYLGQA